MKAIFLLLFVFAAFSIHTAFSQQSVENYNSTDALSAEYTVNLYPNPVTDGVLKVNTNHNIKMVEIINVIGQTVQKEVNNENSTEMTVELANMQKGMYLVRVTFENKKSIIKKVLVKN